MIHEEKGQSIVEFVLVIPILLLLLIGIVDIGRLTFVYASLHFAGQESVRVAGLGGTDEKITNRAYESFFVGDPTELNINPSLLPGERKSGEYITVTLEYPYTPLTPFVSSLFSEPINLTVDSTIRIE
ncbi:hypothetical protein GCM10011351_15960 [Paraliobacillus quinghaiensis]|uniref:TadE-like domain-containing protein n=1 Tax=Paraliobacillus quinghaiensis TaxID=470815 RepID=A0A917WUS7_9BACI|nr:TadE/TadG family type IV pilus assembly protein [Paraliobacillus quinghaiensis]GGM30632.1 hypothetical protein GCM10011351_15960 [Paraliobacillus quinghaiensis]